MKKSKLALLSIIIFTFFFTSCSNTQTNLSNAAKSGNIIEIKNAVNEGADINAAMGKMKNTAFHKAAITGNLNTVRFLLENGASIDAQNKDNNTALHLAIEGNKILVVNYLIENGANLDIKGKYGNTALHQTIIYDNQKLLTKILENNPNLDIQNNMGYSPIFLAYGLNNVSPEEMEKGESAVELQLNQTYLDELLMKGANIDIQDNGGNTLLHHAVLKEDNNNVKYLLDFKANPNILTNYEGTALHIAVENRYDDIAKILIDAGADRNIKNSMGELPSPNIDISYAVENNDIDTVKLYFDLGGSNEVYNKNSATPLHNAIKAGHYEIAKIIIESGVDLNVKDKNTYEEPPLFWAVSFDQFPIVKLLIENGANINERANDNSIALMLASGLGTASIKEPYKGLGQVEVANYLLNNGSEIEVVNSEGKTALDYAYDKECYGVAKILEEKLGKSSNMNFISKAISERKPNLIKMVKNDFETNIKFVQSDYDAARTADYSINISGGISGRDYYDMGYPYYNNNQFQEAAVLFEKSVEAERRKSYPDNEMLGSLLSWTGAAYFEMKQYSKSVKYYKQAIAVLSKISNYDDSYGHVLFRIGHNYYAMQNWNEAIPYFEMTISEYIKEGRKENLNYTLDFYIYLIDYKQGRYNAAREFYKAAITLSNELGDSQKRDFFQGQLNKIAD